MDRMEPLEQGATEGKWKLGSNLGPTCWNIWRCRISEVFNKTLVPLGQKIVHIKRNLDASVETRLNLTKLRSLRCFKHEEFKGWNPPPTPLVKFNTDGASRGNPGLVGAGCVLRDHYGYWIARAAQNVGFTTSMVVELWGIYHGVQLPCDKGYMNIILETDSQAAISLPEGVATTVGCRGT